MKTALCIVMVFGFFLIPAGLSEANDLEKAKKGSRDAKSVSRDVGDIADIVGVGPRAQREKARAKQRQEAADRRAAEAEAKRQAKIEQERIRAGQQPEKVVVVVREPLPNQVEARNQNRGRELIEARNNGTTGSSCPELEQSRKDLEAQRLENERLRAEIERLKLEKEKLELQKELEQKEE